jgi:hypothetical protein
LRASSRWLIHDLAEPNGGRLDEEIGRKLESFRMALESEIERWRGFRRGLHSETEREAFDQLMDMARSFSMAGGAACNPVVFEPMIMSIVLAQHERLQEAEAKLRGVDEQMQEAELRVCERIWQNIKEKGKPW